IRPKLVGSLRVVVEFEELVSELALYLFRILAVGRQFHDSKYSRFAVEVNPTVFLGASTELPQFCHAPFRSEISGRQDRNQRNGLSDPALKSIDQDDVLR